MLALDFRSRVCPPDSVPSKVHLEVIGSDDCLACRQCCHFSPEYASYAPLFTEEQVRRVHAEFPGEDIRFEPHGRLWRIVLWEGPNTEKHVCPLLERETGRCRTHAFGIFDCDTWPYEITERDGRLLLTLTPSCPVVDARLDAMKARAEQLGPQMLEWIRRYPEGVIPYYEGTLILADLGPA